MAINAILPIYDDIDMLKGALIYDSTLFDALIQTKKNLAVEKYCELAARLTTPGCFPPWLLYDVPLACAGTCIEKDSSLKVTDIVGGVVIYPLVTFTPNRKHHHHLVREFFRGHAPQFMSDLLANMRTLGLDQSQPEAFKFHETQPWLIELVYTSTR